MFFFFFFLRMYRRGSCCSLVETRSPVNTQQWMILYHSRHADKPTGTMNLCGWFLSDVANDVEKKVLYETTLI